MNNESNISGKKRKAVRRVGDISSADKSQATEISAGSSQTSSAGADNISSNYPSSSDAAEKTILFDAQTAEQTRSFQLPGRAVRRPQIKQTNKPIYQDPSGTAEFEEAPVVRPSQSREAAEKGLNSVQNIVPSPREGTEIFISPMPNSRQTGDAGLSSSRSETANENAGRADPVKHESPTAELNILISPNTNRSPSPAKDSVGETARPASSSRPQVVKNAGLSHRDQNGAYKQSQTAKRVPASDAGRTDTAASANEPPRQNRSRSNAAQNPNSLRAKIVPVQQAGQEINGPKVSGGRQMPRQDREVSDTVMFSTGNHNGQQSARPGGTQNGYQQSGYSQNAAPDNQMIPVQNQTPSPSAVRGINYEYVKNINDKNAPVSYRSSSGKTNKSGGKSAKKHPDKEPKSGSNTLTSVVKALVYITVVFVVAVVSAVFAISVGNDVFAFVKSDAEYEVTIPEYATLDDITGILHENGIIKYPEIFKIYSYLRKDNGKFIAGTYTVSPSLDYDDLLAEFKEKAPVNVELSVTIPEGYTVDEIIDLFVSKGMSSREELVDAIQNYDFDFWFVKELTDLPESRKYRLEGYLFPDTYYFYSNSSAETIIYKLLSNFNTKVPESYKERCTELNMTLDQIITLASMIQMEAKYSDEYGKVSSVFHNRLNNPSVTNGKLESDATIQYALSERKTDLGQSDLDLDNPYNTYLYNGLPPGPISNPSLNAINWAMYPDKTNYYFFVATASGRSLFAETLAQHNENKKIAASQ